MYQQQNAQKKDLVGYVSLTDNFMKSDFDSQRQSLSYQSNNLMKTRDSKHNSVVPL